MNLNKNRLKELPRQLNSKFYFEEAMTNDTQTGIPNSCSSTQLSEIQ